MKDTLKKTVQQTTPKNLASAAGPKLVFIGGVGHSPGLLEEVRAGSS